MLVFHHDRQGNKVEEACGQQEVESDAEPADWHRIRFAYDANNCLSLTEDGFGAQMRYTYDCLGNMTLEERVIEEGIVQKIHYGYNKNGWRIRRTFDADDQLTEERILDKKNGIDRRSCYTYDAARSILNVSVYGAGSEKVTQKKNLKVTYQYGPKDRLPHQIR